jgi:UrcA family protein
MFAAFESTAARAVIGTVGTALCAGLCLFAATAPANAETVRTATVAYADLNLASPAGRATLNRRIDAAARQVCANNDHGPDAALDEMRCVHHAVSAARTKVYAPQVTAAL